MALLFVCELSQQAKPAPLRVVCVVAFDLPCLQLAVDSVLPMLAIESGCLYQRVCCGIKACAVVWWLSA